MKVRQLRRPNIGDVAINLAGVVGVWLAYQMARTFTEGTAVEAFANAHRVIEWQARLGIDFEPALQAATPIRLLQVANVYYLVHFPVTVAALVVTYIWARDATFRRLRDALVLTTIPAFAIHAIFPLAPPRMFAPFIDTGGIYGPDPYSLPGADAANQLAAMPSLHVAWALVVAVAVWQLDSLIRLRPLAVAHAVLTPIVVVVTANHFVIDIAAGAVIGAVALAISHRVGRSANPTRAARPTRSSESPSLSSLAVSSRAGPQHASAVSAHGLAGSEDDRVGHYIDG